MSAPLLETWVEGYLGYLAEVRRLAKRTVVDVRCTLKRATEVMEKIRPGVELWKLRFEPSRFSKQDCGTPEDRVAFQ